MPETRIALGACERDRIWRSHTGYSFKWDEASQTWASKAPDSSVWVDMHIRTAYADVHTPFTFADR
jgi:hypothetical protein